MLKNLLFSLSLFFCMAATTLASPGDVGVQSGMRGDVLFQGSPQRNPGNQSYYGQSYGYNSYYYNAQPYYGGSYIVTVK